VIPPKKPINPSGKTRNKRIFSSIDEIEFNEPAESPDPFLDQAERDFNRGVQIETPESYSDRLERENKV
jgi:hypothetical protein